MGLCTSWVRHALEAIKAELDVVEGNVEKVDKEAPHAATTLGGRPSDDVDGTPVCSPVVGYGVPFGAWGGG